MELLMNRSCEFVVKSTDIKHPIRAAFIKVLQDYDGGISLDKAVRAEAIDSALGLLLLWRKEIT
jgi:hypothetical protein